MEPLREISREEFNKIREYWRTRAIQLSDFYTYALGWKAAGADLFYSGLAVPCALCFFNHINPKTSNWVKSRKLPPGFRNMEKRSMIHNIIHFSPAGCPSLKPFYSVVGCLRKNEEAEKYYYCQHRVGECPHKECVE